jgi:hypothetical protein
MARVVFTSKLAEHRIDHPDPGQALAINRMRARRGSTRRTTIRWDSACCRGTAR